MPTTKPNIKTIQTSVNFSIYYICKLTHCPGNKYVLSAFCKPVGITPGEDIRMKTTLGLPSKVSQKGYGLVVFYKSSFFIERGVGKVMRFDQHTEVTEWTCSQWVQGFWPLGPLWQFPP